MSNNFCQIKISWAAVANIFPKIDKASFQVRKKIKNHSKTFKQYLLKIDLLQKVIIKCFIYLFYEYILTYRGTKYLLNWQNFRRFYLYIMTENMKNIILRNKHILLSEDLKMRHKLKEHKILSAATLPELDDAYTKRVHNFKTISELYTWSSSINYLPNINIPMIFINALDDPIVPEQLLDPIKKFAGGKWRDMRVQ